MNVRESIENLTNLVLVEINEDKLVEKGDELLNSLRKYFQSHKYEFTDAHIRLLQKYSSSIEAVQEFTEIIEDFQYLTDKEDVDETIGTLYSVVEKVEGLAISARVHKEIRELLEKRENLPSRERREKDIKLSSAIRSLDSSSKPCKKCGARMVIREGDGSFFWGCSTFPSCWGKSRLTKEELSIIQG